MDRPARPHGKAGPEAAPAIRAPRPGEVAADALGLDPFAQMTLSLLRLHMQTFAHPASQGWLAALRLATAHVGPRAAGALCYDLVALVQALRVARSSSFSFNGANCGCCRGWLTMEERQLMQLVAAVRAGQKGAAMTHALLLCEGNPAEDLVAVAEIYCSRHATHPA